jgi:hypothetical protein
MIPYQRFVVVLGFLALLSQKIYLDPRTNAPVEIDVPILGKMKANYPALIFVFLGCAMVVLGLTRYTGVRTIRWLIDGSIISDTPGSTGSMANSPYFRRILTWK